MVTEILKIVCSPILCILSQFNQTTNTQISYTVPGLLQSTLAQTWICDTMKYPGNILLAGIWGQMELWGNKESK